MKYVLKTYHRNTPDQELLDDLKNVAIKLGTDKITMDEYIESGKFGANTITTRFGSWNKALEKAGLGITQKKNFTKTELLQNIEEVWIKLGRQPLYKEMKQPISKYTPPPYEKKFGTFLKALEAFIEFINTDDEQKGETEDNVSDKIQNTEIEFKHKTKRQPSERLKVQVLMRDGNKCRLCGTTLTGDNIHFDHIQPWSKRGETVLENLQVLCETHNIAKGNLEYDDNKTDTTRKT